MTYLRVIPRDLFNEGNLLKCLGKLYINLERFGLENSLEHDGESFDIYQNQDSGSLSVENVRLVLGQQEYPMYRPLNARSSWPLKLVLSEEEEDIDVFQENGEFSNEMEELCRRVQR